MIDEQAHEAIRLTLEWDERRGYLMPYAVRDKLRAAYESAKQKGEAEGLVLVPRVALQPIADIADQYDGMLVEEDAPILAAGQARLRLKHVRAIRAMLSAAGER